MQQSQPTPAPPVNTRLEAPAPANKAPQPAVEEQTRPVTTAAEAPPKADSSNGNPPQGTPSEPTSTKEPEFAPAAPMAKPIVASDSKVAFDPWMASLMAQVQEFNQREFKNPLDAGLHRDVVEVVFSGFERLRASKQPEAVLRQDVKSRMEIINFLQTRLSQFVWQKNAELTEVPCVPLQNSLAPQSILTLHEP